MPENINTSTRYTFCTAERLKSTKDIAYIFANRKYIQHGAIRMYYHEYPNNGVPIQWAFSVSKKNYRNAVDRNIIKRRMREIIRLEKYKLSDNLPNDKTFICFLTYNNKDYIPSYKELSLHIENILKKFIGKMNQ